MINKMVSQHTPFRILPKVIKKYQHRIRTMRLDFNLCISHNRKNALNPYIDGYMTATIQFHASENTYTCHGSFTILAVETALQGYTVANIPHQQPITLSGQDITTFDSAGALAILHFIQLLEHNGNQIHLTNFHNDALNLIDLIKKNEAYLHYTPEAKPKRGIVYTIGEQTVRKIEQFDGVLVLIGSLTDRAFAAMGNWKRFQFASIVSNINTCGLQALPIIALLSFLIGVVLAYQMGLQLESYGANIFIAYLSGMANLREFAPLITAIIVAGRTSSAFTAQIGNMKINEEIDAIETMGLSPVELLVMPKVIALIAIFPLLIFWSDFFSITGSMIMSKMMLNVGYLDFIHRVTQTVGAKQLILGLCKAPVFAILIALVGCFQGFQVESSATSLGLKTTKSVVQALFSIIIADAAYSIIYSWMEL